MHEENISYKVVSKNIYLIWYLHYLLTQVIVTLRTYSQNQNLLL